MDDKIGRIIGLNVGEAAQHPAYNHNWKKVAMKTDRLACQEPGGDFPRGLLNWSLAVDQKLPLNFVAEIPKEEDILTLIVRTLRAVFVQKVDNPIFHCELTAANEGNLVNFLAIPLIGSKGRAIATLQLSLPVDTEFIDWVRFGFWIGYGQEIAAALERAQEAKERKAMEKLSDAANGIMQRPANPQLDECDWCDEYMEAVRGALGANDVHMRVLHKAPDGSDEFHLAGAAGLLAKGRKQTRPVTRPRDGNYSSTLLRQEPKFENTRAKVNEWNSKVHSLKGSDEQQSEFKQLLDLVYAAGVVPVCEDGVVLGSFVVESQKEYFFTERRQRITLAAASLAGAILNNRRVALAKARVEEERNWILGTLGAASQTSADDSLRAITARMVEELGADAASLFIWHDSCQKLVLHIAHNWQAGRKMEGEAAYDLKEGWTGFLGQEGPTVRIVPPITTSLPSRKGKYDEYIFSSQLQHPPTVNDGRIGIRLAANDKLVGVLSLIYYSKRIEEFAENLGRTKALATGLAPVIALGVQAVQQEIMRKRVVELREAETKVADAILEAARPDATWQCVMDTIRDELRVERATYYVCCENRLIRDCFSMASNAACGTPEQTAIEPVGIWSEVIAGKLIALGERQIHSMAQAPFGNAAKGIVLSPVIGKDREVCGVLELVNRKADRDHPYSVFDRTDQSVASDIGRSLGAGVTFKMDELSIREYLARAEQAQRIGAASLSGALGMHQILQPMARIQAATDWLRLHPENSAVEKTARLNQIENAAKEASDSVQLLSEEGVPVPRKITLFMLLRQVFRLIQPQIPASGVDIKITNNLHVVLCVDPLSIVGGLLCLVSNALEAVRQPGNLSISTTFDDARKMAIIRIENTGDLLTPEDIDQFWLPSFTTKGRRYHLGMGLPMALKAFEMAGGSMRMTPREGGGAVTLVSLPIVE